MIVSHCVCGNCRGCRGMIALEAIHNITRLVVQHHEPEPCAAAIEWRVGPVIEESTEGVAP